MSSLPIEITEFTYRGFHGWLKVGDEKRAIRVNFFPSAWTYCFGVCLEDVIVYLSNAEALTRFLLDLSTAAWKFDFVKYFGFIVHCRTSLEWLKEIYRRGRVLDENWALDLLATMYRSLAHQRGEVYKLEIFKKAIRLLEERLGRPLIEWQRKAERLRLRWLARQLRPSIWRFHHGESRLLR